MKIETLKTINRMFNSSCKEYSRQFISGVYVKVIDTKTNTYDLVSTDGKKMIIIKVIDEDLILFADKLINNENMIGLKNFLKSCKDFSSDLVVESMSGGHLIIKSVSSAISPLVLVLSTVSYPNYSQLIPDYKKSVSIAFDVKLLSDIIKSIDDKNTNVKITFNPANKLEPIKVSNSTFEGLAILMPLRI